MSLQYDPQVAIDALAAIDPELATLIRRVGPFKIKMRSRMTPYHTLLQSIIYQQISGVAAASIHRRVRALFPRGCEPTPRRLLEMSDETLRSAGLSRPKIQSARELALRTLDGTIPGRRALRTMPDEEVVERLVCVRGIGNWTAQMMLIFHLGRPDVLPVTDLGVRRGFMIAQGKKQMPTPKALERHGERWRPYRSVASWYLWRANDLVEEE